jgi:hypothetical protein
MYIVLWYLANERKETTITYPGELHVYGRQNTRNIKLEYH